MRLRLLVPCLVDQWPNVAEIVKALEGASIKTTYELLFSGPPEVIYGRLDMALLTFPQFTELHEQIALLSSTQGETGPQAYSHEMEEEAAIVGGDTGVEDLDNLLAGAFSAYGVVELSGSMASLMALWVVLRHLTLYEDSDSWWIDTTSDFSVDQAAAITQAIQSQTSLAALDRLQICSAVNLTAVHDVLDALAVVLKRRLLRTIANPLKPATLS
ncbi:hypothetical protein FRB97_000409 [Tulasnella sp. 331]|nr:hypothetical protein FRB97_000409 [Tulasnella sp. 331]